MQGVVRGLKVKTSWIQYYYNIFLHTVELPARQNFLLQYSHDTVV
jgi:hypothetical protein